MRPLQQAMPGALVDILRDTPLSPGKIGFAWRAAVGPAVDKMTSVHLENGVLIVEAATKAWTREVKRSTPIVLVRLQTLLGADTVRAITVRDHA